MKHYVQTAFFGRASEVSLPDMPFPMELSDRQETKPRLPTHMVSSKPSPYERFVAALREVSA